MNQKPPVSTATGHSDTRWFTMASTVLPTHTAALAVLPHFSASGAFLPASQCLRSPLSHARSRAISSRAHAAARFYPARLLDARIAGASCLRSLPLITLRRRQQAPPTAGGGSAVGMVATASSSRTESPMTTGSHQSPNRSLHQNRRPPIRVRARQFIGRWIVCQHQVPAAVGELRR